MTNETFQPEIIKPTELPRTSVTHFKAKLDSATGETSEFTNDSGVTRATRRVSFKFVNMEVLAATEPFPFQVLEIPITYNDGRPNTPWGAFAQSVIDVTGQELPFNDLVDKMQEWKWLPAKMNRPDDTGKWGMVDAMAWQLVWLEGYESGDAPKIMDLIIAMADGKTETEFNAAFLAETSYSTLAGYKDAMSAVMEREILGSLVAGGKLSFDGETYAKV